MQVRNKYVIQNIKQLLFDYRFKLIIMFALCFNFIGAIYFAHNSYYLEGILKIFTDIYYVATFMALLLFNTFNTYNMFEKNTPYIIRFNSKKEYLMQLIKNVITSNTILFVINLLVSLIFLTIFGGKLIIQDYMNYNILNVVYITFYLLRFFILSSIISCINVCLLKLMDSKFVVLLNSVFWISIIFYPYSSTLINNILSMPIITCEYFRVIPYSSFFIESACSCIYIIFLVVIMIIIFNISRKKIRQIGE